MGCLINNNLSILKVYRATAYKCSPVKYMYMYMYKTALGVLCCFALFVCLTLLASFFLPSHLSFKNMYNVHIHVHVYTCMFKEDSLHVL